MRTCWPHPADGNAPNLHSIFVFLGFVFNRSGLTGLRIFLAERTEGKLVQNNVENVMEI